MITFIKIDFAANTIVTFAGGFSLADPKATALQRAPVGLNSTVATAPHGNIIFTAATAV